MKRIVVCGGGYGGISFLRNFPDFQNFEITLIDQNPFHYLQPEVYSYIAHEALLSEIIVDLYSLTYGISKNLKFVKDKVLNIDFNKNEVITEKNKFNYDYLVIALGSRTFFPRINGLREFSSGVKTVERSMQFKHNFEKNIFHKIKNENLFYSKDKKEFNIVIGGGGLSGVEIAAEMAYFERNLLKGSKCLVKSLNIILIEALPTILTGMGDYIIENSMKRLKDLGVNVITGKKIVKVDKHLVVLDNGNEIISDFLIWTGGIIASTVMDNLDIKKNNKNQVIVNEYFQPENIDNVFVVGDCAEIRDIESGEILPPTAQIAIKSGKAVAKYIYNIEQGKNISPEPIKMEGILSALGGKYAVGKVKNLYIKGFKAYLLKQAILKSYKLPLYFTAKNGVKMVCLLR